MSPIEHFESCSLNQTREKTNWYSARLIFQLTEKNFHGKCLWNCITKVVQAITTIQMQFHLKFDSLQEILQQLKLSAHMAHSLLLQIHFYFVFILYQANCDLLGYPLQYGVTRQNNKFQAGHISNTARISSHLRRIYILNGKTIVVANKFPQ